jgi:hypothetical protein
MLEIHSREGYEEEVLAGANLVLEMRVVIGPPGRTGTSVIWCDFLYEAQL